LPQNTLAQTKDGLPYNCDAMLAIFDNVAATAATATNKDSALIIVAYRGHGEERRYNAQRLKALRFYFTRKMPKQRLVLTEGKRRIGLGKVEFYVEGKLTDELYLVKRGQVCTSCCPAVDESRRGGKIGTLKRRTTVLLSVKGKTSSFLRVNKL